jgi:hypothetical protein
MPMDFASDALGMLDPLEFATTVTYTPLVGSPTTINVLLDFGVNRIGFESDVSSTHDECTFRNADIATPKRGDTVSDGVTTKTFVSEIDNDLTVSVWLVK